MSVFEVHVVSVVSLGGDLGVLGQDFLPVVCLAVQLALVLLVIVLSATK